MTKASLAGSCILVVEDEALIAMLLEDAVLEAGGLVIGPARTVDEALHLVACTPRLDAATLDINLAGRHSGPVAERLIERRVPFVVVSGYGGGESFPEAARNVAVITKPFIAAELVAALVRLIGVARER